MTYRDFRRAAVLGGATGVRIAEAARPLSARAAPPAAPSAPAVRHRRGRYGRRSAGAVFIPAQRSRPPRRFEPYGPDHGTAGYHRFRRRPPPGPVG